MNMAKPENASLKTETIFREDNRHNKYNNHTTYSLWENAKFHTFANKAQFTKQIGLEAKDVLAALAWSLERGDWHK